MLCTYVSELDNVWHNFEFMLTPTLQLAYVRTSMTVIVGQRLTGQMLRMRCSFQII